MATKKFSEFAAATTIAGADDLVGLQGGVNKRFPKSLFGSFDAPVTIAPSTSGSRNLDKGIDLSQWLTGSGSTPTLNLIKIWADDTDAGSGFVQGAVVDHYFGGSAAKGGRLAFSANLYLTAATNGASLNGNYVAVTGVATALDHDGGTGLGISTSKGAVFGGGFVGRAANGAINLLCVTAAEFNTVIETGASAYQKTIIQLSARSDDRVKGTVVDAMILASNQNSSNPKWTHGILFDYPADPTVFPFGSSSTVLATGVGTIGIGVDFSASTVTTAAFKSPGFLVDGGGIVTLAATSTSANSGLVINAGSASGIGSIEIGGGAGGYIDLKLPFSDDYDMRLSVLAGSAGSLQTAAGVSLSFLAGGSGNEIAFFTNSVKRLSILDGAASFSGPLASGELTVNGNASAVGGFFSSPTSGDARIVGTATTATDRVRNEGHIPGVGAWYWGVDGSDSSKFKFSWNSSSFATPALTLNASTGAATFSNLLQSTGPTAGVGYATGAGGTVTQATSKSTGVTLNKVSGAITMNNAALAGGATVIFTVTNSTVAATDLIVAHIAGGGTADAYDVSVTAVAAGSFHLAVDNTTGGSLSESPVINFAVIKGVTS